MSYLRYVALGDSQTEGVGDDDDRVGVRGLADRLAERLATINPDLRYANLAVRGKLAGQVHAEQLAAALALWPDLATVVAGVNDVLRPGFDVDEIADHLDAMFAALTAQGAVVATVTFPDVARITPLARPISGRIAALNDRIRADAERHGVVVAETARHPVVTDPRLWSADRLHASPLGHQRIADALAHALRLPGSDDHWTDPLQPPMPARSPLVTAADELQWVATFLGPWLRRRLTGRSSGDGRTAKRPELLPVELADTGAP
ncbi:SGNH/GDSL hydrolase family protein [Nocardia cyriacigeorgica]|uniref:SGNH/GDSL hydrolase family protein n=1 Tax=Nocardia cyriacigeorgica TaxID=135487 RepID=A0ABX0CHH5_9NOCA|nr:SGNH/GDSL hydrolase family protein [Nocardia cyriacigeorgica]NEW39210.1 SGNH/GDSL hydrolase family protein [Nocardia cyriacigeorgica]NEW49714.1 SGNH/GDSL hydrolase family protein [Nocardia cyriacigeorgica]NEW56005.1 SGNH/GDSL hydrolase family protein [Nocardia cyriacigeorgica]